MSARKNKPRAMDGSGNVFADLGLPNAEQELVKASLTLRIQWLLTSAGSVVDTIDLESIGCRIARELRKSRVLIPKPVVQ
jgi:hypothetical protein